jgi:hypothetical protein
MLRGDTDDDDRRHGMGIVLEYARHAGKAPWIAPPKCRWTIRALPRVARAHLLPRLLKQRWARGR